MLPLTPAASLPVSLSVCQTVWVGGAAAELSVALGDGGQF